MNDGLAYEVARWAMWLDEVLPKKPETQGKLELGLTVEWNLDDGELSIEGDIDSRCALNVEQKDGWFTFTGYAVYDGEYAGEETLEIRSTKKMRFKTMVVTAWVQMMWLRDYWETRAANDPEWQAR